MPTCLLIVLKDICEFQDIDKIIFLYNDLYI